MGNALRVQIVSDIDFIEEFVQRANNDDELGAERHELPAGGDQKFGLIEIAAIIATFHGAAKLAETIVDIWAKTKRPTKVKIKTPKGSLTVEGDGSKSVDTLIEELKPLIA